MNLYWLTTENGTENWFVVAKSQKRAQYFFENAEGFDEDESSSKLVCLISKNIIEKYKLKKEQFPKMELLKDLGAYIYSEDIPRIVNIDGITYQEGQLTYFSSFKRLKNKTGVYMIKIQNSDTYKIGITKNLKERIANFSTGNPYPIKIEYFIETTHYKSLEKHFHELFKENRMKGEWFNFSNTKFLELEGHLAILHKSDQFFVHDLKGLYEWLYK